MQQCASPERCEDNKVRETLQDVIAASLPMAFVSQIYPKINGIYQEAAASVRGMTMIEEPERRHLLPYLRRNLVEAGIRKLALDCGLMATVEWTETGSSQFTLIRTSRARLTLSKTKHDWSLPDNCYFRKQNSRVNDMLMQGALFPVAAPSSEDNNLLYAIITHGPEPRSDALGFVSIGFPCPDMKSWAEPTVSILSIQERQQLSMKKPIDAQSKEQQQKRTGKLKKNIRQKKDDSEGVA
jgi:hypothetical protein